MSSVNKKVTLDKNDLRRLMKEKRGSLINNYKKIESPYAKYNALGQLWCTLCNCPVKTNLLWNAHMQGRTHKENLNVHMKGVSPNVVPLTTVNPVKRKATVVFDDDDDSSATDKKYIRGENVSSASSSSILPGDFFDNKSTAPLTENSVSLPVPTSSSALPPDFFDSPVDTPPTSIEPITAAAIAEKLPEGFFDDPKMDAKVRQVPYKDKMEDEWELFQKSMKEEAMVSEALVEEDDEMREEERNIEEIDDQLNRWSRVTDLLKKKEKMASNVNMEQKLDDASDSDVDNNTDFDEFLDWRSKKAWK